MNKRYLMKAVACIWLMTMLSITGCRKLGRKYRDADKTGIGDADRRKEIQRRRHRRKRNVWIPDSW